MSRARKTLRLAIASVYKGYQDPNYTMREMLRVGYYLLYFSVHSRSAIVESTKFSVNPKFHVAQRLWSLFDSFGLKQINEAFNPKIKFRKTLYLLREEKEINIEYIKYLTDLIQKDSHQVFHSSKENPKSLIEFSDLKPNYLEFIQEGDENGSHSFDI